MGKEKRKEMDIGRVVPDEARSSGIARRYIGESSTKPDGLVFWSFACSAAG
jgi:hypothetical protein